MRLVLDTNVVLDWLVFGDPATRVLAEAVQAGRTRVLAHERTREELRRVLAYPALGLDDRRQAQVFDAYCAMTLTVELAWPLTHDDLRLPPDFPRCRDRDDQYFLALAYHSRADALVSRDKNVLRLRRRAARFGIAIVDVRQLQELPGSGASGER